MAQQGSRFVGGVTLVPLTAQGLYWTLTGAWPLLHMNSFLMVTGPKRDLWLVRAVAVLITVIGLTLLFGALRRTRAPEVAFLAITGAMALIGVDVIAVVTGTASPIYLFDALAQAAIILIWAGALFMERGGPSRDWAHGHLARQVFG